MCNFHLHIGQCLAGIKSGVHNGRQSDLRNIMQQIITTVVTEEHGEPIHNIIPRYMLPHHYLNNQGNPHHGPFLVTCLEILDIVSK